jgi:hypothetical protein
MGVITNILRQMNAKMEKDLFRIKLSKCYSETMVVGVYIIK